jgi:hypothetical protein
MDGHRGKKSHSDMVSEIISDFDFNKVHRVMKFLDWQWAKLGAVPSAEDLQKEAQRLLGSLEGEPGVKGTGGLRASLKNEGTLSLKCILTESWSDPDAE